MGVYGYGYACFHTHHLAVGDTRELCIHGHGHCILGPHDSHGWGGRQRLYTLSYTPLVTCSILHFAGYAYLAVHVVHLVLMPVIAVSDPRLCILSFTPLVTSAFLHIGVPMVMYFPAHLIVILSHILLCFCRLCTHILSLRYSQLAPVTYIPMHTKYTTVFNFGYQLMAALFCHCITRIELDCYSNYYLRSFISWMFAAKLGLVTIA